MPRLIAAIDQGTTSTRCMLFDESGPRTTAQREHRQIFPQPGWVEHDAMEIWQRTQQVIADATASSRDIAAIGVTNQRETTVVWEKSSGRPIYNAIVWQDTRTQSICDELAKAGGVDRFRELTGLPLATYFSATKLRWILDNIPGARTRAERGELLFGTIDTWLIWNLTGAHVTDVTNASRTMLMNLGTLAWDEDLLAAFNVPRGMLPTIVSSSDANAYGVTRADGPFAAQIPVCGDLGDQQAALVGQACFNPGECKNTYGTGCFMLLNTGEKIVQSERGLLTTVAYRFASEPARYALEGSVAVAGALVQWLRDNLKMIGSSKEIESLARSVPDNGGVYFVPAFSGLFAPRWRPDARGTIVGLSAHSSRGHIARAALEAAAYQTLDVLDAMRGESGVAVTSLKVDGGMSANDLLMQFQSDMLNLRVVRSHCLETTALGAACAAGLAIGFWKNTAQLAAQWRAGKTWSPVISDETRQRLYHQWLKAVDRSLGWIE